MKINGVSVFFTCLGKKRFFFVEEEKKTWQFDAPEYRSKKESYFLKEIQQQAQRLFPPLQENKTE